MPVTPKDVACEWLALAWNTGSDAGIDRLMSANALCHGLPSSEGRPVLGPGDFKACARRFRSAFPDLRVSVVKTIAEGEFVAVHCRMTGTHMGPGLEVPPTMKPVRFVGVAIVQVRNGRIVESWHSFDFLSLQQQIGLAAPAGAGFGTAPASPGATTWQSA